MKGYNQSLAAFLLLFAGFVSADGQTLDDFGRIAIKPLANRAQLRNDEAATLLETRMSQITTAGGIVSTDVNPRFVMTATVNILTKDIVPGPPQMISQKLEITFTVGDAVEKKAFSTTSVELIGAGANETKAYMEAIKKINARNPAFKSFVEEAKTKIVSYYQTNCEAIQRDAKALASQGKYDAAIYNLSLIPDVCKQCYEQSQKLQATLYTQKIESEGQTLFQQAKAAWIQAPNKENASAVSRLVARIDPNVSFHSEVNAFIDKVSAVVQAQQQQEWEQQRREWEQSVREWEQANKERERAYADNQQARAARAAREHELEKMRINACREIAVEYVRNQPKTEYYIIW